MMTIFGLFKTYEKAGAVVDELMEAGAEPSSMNVLVKSDVAKPAMDVNLRRAGVATSDEVGEVELHGLERLVGGEQPMPLPGLGDVYAAGELATFVATAGQEHRDKDSGLEAALHEFGLNAKTAATYYRGIEEGEWLIFVRADDDEAKRLLSVLRKYTDAITTVSA